MDHGRISLNSVLLLLLVNFVSGFRFELIYICPSLQISASFTPWFAAAFAAVVACTNHFFDLYQQNKSSESKVKVRHASKCSKRVLGAVELAYVNKTKESITSQ